MCARCKIHVFNFMDPSMWQRTGTNGTNYSSQFYTYTVYIYSKSLPIQCRYKEKSYYIKIALLALSSEITDSNAKWTAYHRVGQEQWAAVQVDTVRNLTRSRTFFCPCRLICGAPRFKSTSRVIITITSRCWLTRVGIMTLTREKNCSKLNFACEQKELLYLKIK